VVHGDEKIQKKLGRDDPCPYGSGRRLRAMLRRDGTPR
jgi:hypothetical protein